jgi:hypothetical protein
MSHLPHLLFRAQRFKGCPQIYRRFLIRPQLLTRVSAVFSRGQDTLTLHSRAGAPFTGDRWQLSQGTLLCARSSPFGSRGLLLSFVTCVRGLSMLPPYFPSSGGTSVVEPV